jgi:hypothetical protein
MVGRYYLLQALSFATGALDGDCFAFLCLRLHRAVYILFLRCFPMVFGGRVSRREAQTCSDCWLPGGEYYSVRKVP